MNTEYIENIKAGKDKQFIYCVEEEKVKCKCGHPAVFWRTAFLCGTITAYPCKYNYI